MTERDEADGSSNQRRIDAQWERLVKDADEASPAENWFDRALRPLVHAAHPTELRRFYAFTSMNRLCFAETAYPSQGLQQAFVAFLPDGGYAVHAESPYGVERAGEAELETGDAEEAIDEVLRVLRMGREA
jgi:hypothetical protein